MLSLPDKADLRRQFRAQAEQFLKDTPAEQLAGVQRSLGLALKSLIDEHQAQKIAAYIPMRLELPVISMLEAAKALAGRELFVPPADIKQIGFVKASTADVLVPATEVDLVIVPGLYVDAGGYRLGKGKGWYDRALAATGPARPVTVFAGYSWQIVSVLPHEDHDIRIDYAVSERGLIRLKKL